MSHSLLDHTLLHLSLIEGIGPVTIAQLLERLPGDALLDLYAMSALDISQRCSIAQAQAQKIAQGLADRSLLEQELARCSMHNVSWITLLDQQYPTLLKHIYAPPIVLYWLGTLPSDSTHTIAIVGSRKANAYGQRVIDTFVPA